MSSNKVENVSSLIGYRLKATQHALRLQMDEALRSLDLTTPQYSVLAQLELKPGISNASLARSSFITAQTMHGIISNLEKRKLVERSSDPEHGRILSASLSKEGLAMVQKAHQMICDVEARMLRTLSPEKKVLLEEILSECFANLQEGAN